MGNFNGNDKTISNLNIQRNSDGTGLFGWISKDSGDLIYIKDLTLENAKVEGWDFIGALAGTALWRVQLNGDTEVMREAIFSELGERIRDVEQGPDDWIYLLTDSGKLIQIRD